MNIGGRWTTYTLAFVDQMTDMVTASTVIAYALYTFNAPNLPDNHAMMLCLVHLLHSSSSK